jgi:hypothetical protein
MNEACFTRLVKRASSAPSYIELTLYCAKPGVRLNFMRKINLALHKEYFLLFGRKCDICIAFDPNNQQLYKIEGK